MNKRISILLGLILSTLIHAQEKGNYLNINLGGGLHNLSYTLQDGTQKGNTGISAGIGFSHFFTRQWGFQTGLGIETFNATSTLNVLEATPAIDSDGDAYIFKSDIRGWKENQSSVYLEIPLTGQFKYTYSDKIGIISTFGAKVAFPINTTYKTTGGEIVTSGYYPQWDAELTDMPQHGFTTIHPTFNGDYSLKALYSAVVELGGIYKLSDKQHLYIGGYLNYGLNNVLSPETKKVYLVDGGYSGVLGTYQTKSIKPFSIGLKLGLYFKL
ncbi:PorT family protein [Parabacteroides sp. FAFU027]|uniref:PorT family protein n=1 Tax=Parabacteroides sp. FAFU027 TaxID=2922715 RepID=UPI001FAE8BCC|nr:PorT family protein [Parabacteroides sp. FAFU027]